MQPNVRPAATWSAGIFDEAAAASITLHEPDPCVYGVPCLEPAVAIGMIP